VNSLLRGNLGDVPRKLRKIEKPDFVAVRRAIERLGRAACAGTQDCYFHCWPL
jgi:hypothetical protein